MNKELPFLEDVKNYEISFGSAGDRKLYPEDIPPSRFGAQIGSLEKNVNLGPGYYPVHKYDLVHKFDTQPRSKKGYILAARTNPRFRPDITFDVTPDPGKYQSIERKPTSPSLYPFNSNSKRSNEESRAQPIPGPGTYESSVKGCRRVSYQQSFGGTPTNLPCIQVRSTIDRNTDKLQSTNDDYRYNRKLACLKLYY